MFKKLSVGSGNVLGFQIDELTTDEEVSEIGRIISGRVSLSGKIRLLIEIDGFRHMDTEYLRERLSFVMDHSLEIERMAVLSNRVWIKSWVKVGGLKTDTVVEYFDRHEMESALKWICE